MAPDPQDVYNLKKGYSYRVVRDFSDYYGNMFREGEQLTFVHLDFLPYHGGYTVLFKERTLYLQEEQNSRVLQALGGYLQLVEDGQMH